MSDHLAQIISRLHREMAMQSTLLVGIDGLGGAGKTLTAAAIADTLHSMGLVVMVVHIDDFFLPSADRPQGTPEMKPIGGDFDWQRLRDEVLLPLRNKRFARYRRYDWKRDELAETHEIQACGIIVVEGVYCTRRELADLYDIRVWIDCPRDVRLARGINRDGETGRNRWEFDWQPCEERYVQEHDPKQTAHFVIPGQTA